MNKCHPAHSINNLANVLSLFNGIQTFLPLKNNVVHARAIFLRHS